MFIFFWGGRWASPTRRCQGSNEAMSSQRRRQAAAAGEIYRRFLHGRPSGRGQARTPQTRLISNMIAPHFIDMFLGSEIKALPLIPLLSIESDSKSSFSRSRSISSDPAIMDILGIMLENLTSLELNRIRDEQNYK